MPVEQNAASDRSLAEALQRARTALGPELDALLYHGAREVQEALLENPGLGEQHLAVLLARKNVSGEVVARIAANRQWMKSYAIRAAVVKHPRTPRHVAVPLLKFIYLFDLMAITSTPGISPDVKRLAEDAILAQHEGLALGKRLTLARRGSWRIAGELLLDPDPRVCRAALSNPSLTEDRVAAALLSASAGPDLTQAVASHSRWSKRKEIALALLHCENLSLAQFASLLTGLTLPELKELAGHPRLSANRRAYVAKLVQARRLRQAPKRI